MDNGDPKFYKIKFTEFQNNMQTLKILQIINVSSQVLYDTKSAETQLLQLINACVSHEMRNPINAIHGQNL